MAVLMSFSIYQLPLLIKQSGEVESDNPILLPIYNLSLEKRVLLSVYRYIHLEFGAVLIEKDKRTTDKRTPFCWLRF